MRNKNAVKAIGGLFAGFLLAGFSTVASAQIRYDVVGAGDTGRWQVCRAAGQWTSVAMKGDGGTDLDLYVYDDQGRLVDSDIGWTDEGLVRWTTLRTSCFEVQVVNRGSLPNLYILVVD